jgi:hypothetical protein
MTHAVEMDSGVMTLLPIFIKIGSGLLKLRRIYRHINKKVILWPTFIVFKTKKVRQELCSRSVFKGFIHSQDIHLLFHQRELTFSSSCSTRSAFSFTVKV